MLIDIPSVAPLLCVVIEFDNARAQAALGVFTDQSVFANRFCAFPRHAALSASLESVGVI